MNYVLPPLAALFIGLGLGLISTIGEKPVHRENRTVQYACALERVRNENTLILGGGSVVFGLFLAAIAVGWIF
jgi:hypothetical protein